VLEKSTSGPVRLSRSRGKEISQGGGLSRSYWEVLGGSYKSWEEVKRVQQITSSSNSIGKGEKTVKVWTTWRSSHKEERPSVENVFTF